jgi:hypothetical protein
MSIDLVSRHGFRVLDDEDDDPLGPAAQVFEQGEATDRHFPAL